MTETKTLKNFVGGEYVDAADGRTYDLVNPATGEVFAQAPLSGEEDVDRAFRAAEKGFETWRDTTPSERQLAMFRLADAIEERAEELVRAESENTGKPFGLTMEEEIPQGVDQIRFFAGACRVLEGKSAGARCLAPRRQTTEVRCSGVLAIGPARQNGQGSNGAVRRSYRPQSNVGVPERRHRPIHGQRSHVGERAGECGAV